MFCLVSALAFLFRPLLCLGGPLLCLGGQLLGRGNEDTLRGQPPQPSVVDAQIEAGGLLFGHTDGAGSCKASSDILGYAPRR